MLANATAYSCAIFDPVLVAMAVLTGPRWSVGKEAKRRVAGLLGYLVSMIIVAVTIGGGYYWSGVRYTVLDRAAGSDAAIEVLGQAASWIWLVTLLAALAAAVALGARGAGARRLLPLVLLGAALLAPLEQARLHTLTSLDKHTDMGAWFAAIAAGYLVDVVIRWIRPRAVRVAAAVALAAGLLVPGLTATQQATELFSWPNGADFVADFPEYAGSSGPLLVEDPSIGEYYLPSGMQWQRWSNTRSILLPSGHGLKATAGADLPAAFQRAIARGYFATVALNFESTPPLDQTLAAQLNQSHLYRLVGTIPYGTGAYTIWQLKTMPLPPQPGLAGRGQAAQAGAGQTQTGQQAG
jgi:hypothetical protein